MLTDDGYLNAHSGHRLRTRGVPRLGIVMPNLGIWARGKSPQLRGDVRFEDDLGGAASTTARILRNAAWRKRGPFGPTRTCPCRRSRVLGGRFDPARAPRWPRE